MTLALGIDLGGTKIEIVALAADGLEVLRRRRPTPRDYEGTLAAIGSLVEEAEAELGRRGTVGVGTPGALSPVTGLIKNANSVWLNGRPLDSDLARALDRPVALANDADCLVLSEATDGAAAGAASVFAAILGTGVGGGIATHGRPLAGPNAIAGEWGHNPLPWPQDGELPGPDCYCGKRGCVETWLAGPSLQRDHREVSGQDRTGAEIAAAAEAGDDAATATLHRYTDRLARGLAHVVNVLDPDVIVLGGGVSNISALYQTVPGLLAEWVFGGEVATPLRPAAHGDSSGVRGAAGLWR